ncbi:gp53-like domain-containing protein [Citrobacter freundii]|uniref:gp53-like domain-containing protein n=1 Tax=Citrobacter freundii TaxID=546 RepID=UPI00397E8DBD
MKLYNLASAGFFIAKNPGGKMELSLLAANNAQTVLAAGISSTATSLTVNTGTGTLFPSPVTGTSFFKLTIIDAATGSLTEIVHVTARNGDVFTIQRGQEGTVARAWSANDIAANMMTAGTLSYILGNFQPLDPTLTALAELVGVANKLPYFNGNDTAALTDLTQVGRDIIGKSTIAGILTYLGLGSLGSASGRNVGNVNSYDIPDMSYFTLTGKGTDNLMVKGPNGLIIQVFRRILPNSTIIGIPQTLAVTYPTPFPVNVWGVFCTKRTYAQIVTSCESANSTGFDAVTCLTSGTSPDSNNSQAVFLAFGY